MSNSSPKQSFARAANPNAKPKRKRPAPLSVRLSDDEKAQLKRDANGGSVHALARERLLRKRSTRNTASASVDRELAAQLLAKLGQSHLASNMNQLAKAANTGRLPVSADLALALYQACGDIKEMRVLLTMALGLKPKG